MNILNKLTVKSLQMNKKRTIVTIIGIILSTALIAAVSTMVVSFRETMIEHSRQTDGNYHYNFYDVPVDDLKYFKNNRNIEAMYTIREAGYSYLKESTNSLKPYLRLLEFDSSALLNSSIKLVEGRMPQNSNEIVIAKHIKTNGGVSFNIGQKLTLDISERLLIEDDYPLHQSNTYVENDEYLKSMYTKEFEIVGIIERPNYDIENRFCPGYSIITYMDNESKENLDVYTLFTKKALKEQYKVLSQIIGVDEKLVSEVIGGDNYSLEKSIQLRETQKYDFEKNQGLFRFESFEMGASILSTLLGAAIVVIIIIIVTSVFCIRNSFAISITEKMKQYGMLASIGATPKQIRKNVLYEGLILAVIGIPLGILGGLFAVFILLKVVSTILFEYLDGIQFIFTFSWLAIFIAIVLSLVTIYLSAITSAIRASRVSPIEAIRGNNDINIKSKKLKSSKLIKKIFGIGGQIADKNLKRNKKKYRTTVVSIVVSVAIFIAMSSFLTYAFKTSSIYYKERAFNISLSSGTKDSYDDFRKISLLDGIKNFAIYKENNLTVNVSNLKLANDYKDYITGDSNNNLDINIYGLNNEQFRKYVKELGLNYGECKEQVILADYHTQYEYDEEGKKGTYVTKRYYDYVPGDIITGKFYIGANEYSEDLNIKIAACADKNPIGFESVNHFGGIIVVDEYYFDKLINFNLGTQMYIKAENADNIQDIILKDYGEKHSVNNYDQMMRQDNAMQLVISIFLYGFMIVISLIGVTNIFNTITTNMNLRSREFAMLKSIGMTNKEFNRMIRLESILYGVKSLLIGIPIGLVFSYFFYKQFVNTLEMKFTLPYLSLSIVIIAVFVLIGCIMKYSLNKINKQNIIETIRKDNI